MPESSLKNLCLDASRTLQEKRRGMVSRFFTDRPPEFMADYTRLLDDYFRASFENSMIGPSMGIAKNPYAIIALGGYGREEQCVHSDVDILFLFKKELPKKAEALIREIIYPLWDIGLDIGHATRSLKDCISLAAKDFEVLMSLLDARFVCGMSPLYSDLMEKVREKIVFRRAGKIADWLIKTTRDRHRAYGDSAYLLEPNLKEGRGGLRDYHAMLWLSRVRFNLEKPRDLEYHGHLAHDEFQELRRSLAFVWKVRSGLHILTGRKYDQLHFENQVELAGRFGYLQDLRRHAVEQFLGDLHGHMDIIKQTQRRFIQEAGRARRRFAFKRDVPAAPAAGVEIRKQTLSFASAKGIIDDPECLVRIFEESVRLNLPIGQEARRLIREFRHLMDGKAICFSRAARTFDQALLQPASEEHDVLTEMHATGMLTQCVPEMTGVVNRIEYDTYHVYPVDRHLLRTVAAVNRFGAVDAGGRDLLDASVQRDLCRAIFEDIPDRRPLVWAALLHDIGKGVQDLPHAEAGESIARAVLERLGYPREMIDTVAFLVRRHQLLAHTAARRDIDNAETALHLARKIGDLSRLNMLYLLSVADLMATGPKAWNEWTAVLLRNLFLKAVRLLSPNEAGAGDAAVPAGEKVREIAAGQPHGRERAEMEALFRVMSPRYLESTPASEILAHIDLFRRLGEKPFVWKVDKMSGSDTRKVAIVGRDIPGFFSNIAGILALNRIDVLDAQVHTWRNHIAICIFRVTPPPDPLFEDDRWMRAGQELSAAMLGKLDVRGALGENSPPPAAGCLPDPPDAVHVDNTASDCFTIIEVHTRDTPGLLYRLTHTLFRCGLDIWSAQIATRADQVVDVFYVRDFDGRKLESREKIDRVTSSIRTRIRPQTGRETASDPPAAEECRPATAAGNGVA